MPVTVVTPVWDEYCRFLPSWVENVSAQEPRPRMVVVDNASSQTLPWLPAGVEVRKTGGRLSAGLARNVGLGAVETRYVCFADVDDRMLPGTLAFCAARMDADPGLVACATGVLDWYPERGVAVRNRRPRRPAYVFAGHRTLFALYQLAFLSALSTTTGTVFRTDAVRAAGGFGDMSLAEDSILALRIAWHGRIELHRRAGRLYRIRAGSLTHRQVQRREWAEGMRAIRAALCAEPAAPRLLKAAMPAVSLLHQAKVEMLVRRGGMH
jgi:cellulose synthase/poly-beta-1,6-N-acetylglucosamine synthase-like glycosyltransferase